jgi:CSLREA domain-containing protein
VKVIARRGLFSVSVLAATLGLLGAGVAHANVIVVDTAADATGVANLCTLRDAITVTNNDNGAGLGGCGAGSGADVIHISATGTIGLMTQLPVITDDTTVTGPGVSQLTVQRLAAAKFRVFQVNAPGANVSISDLTVDKGADEHVGTGDVGAVGGGIFNNVGNLTLDRVVVTNSTVNAVSFGGSAANSARAYGAGIYNVGTMTIRNSFVSTNTATASADGAQAVKALGGGISNAGTLHMTDSTVGANHVAVSGFAEADAFGGGLYNVRDFGSAGVLTIDGSTILDNHAGDGTGGRGGGGGGISNAGALTVTNSTLAFNFADDFGGGVDNFAEISAYTGDPTVSLNAVTVTGNTGNADGDAFGGGGGTQNGNAAPAEFRVGNTVYAGNSVMPGGTDTPQCTGNSYISAGYNLRETADALCAGFTGPGDAAGNAFFLYPLSFANGGPTATRALVPGSAPVDAGNPATPGSGGAACPATDQRGLYRGGTAGRCDIGAFELGATTNPPPPPAQPATGRRAAALKQCKKKARKHHWPPKKLKKCKKKAQALPV